MQKSIWTACLLTSLATAAHSGDALTDAINAAYPAYRAALFRTNSQAQAESRLAIEQAQAGWKALIDQHGKAPPPPYDRDPAVLSTLQEVARVYAQADGQIQAGKLAEAHETLESARDLMAELRRRNGVITFSDHMNAYHAEMEHVLAAAKTLDTARLLPLMGRVGVLDYLARRLRSEAPPALANNPAFSTALREVEQSVATLHQAILAQDLDQVRSAIGQLKKPYSQMFLRFG